MSTSPHQSSRPDKNGQFQSTDRRRKADTGMTQCGDRRKQQDRRRLTGRRASDWQLTNPSLQMDSTKNPPAEERADNKSQLRETAARSRIAAFVLSEDEVRFLLDDD